MRALFVTKHLRVGGAQRNWTILLPALARRGFAPQLLTLEDGGELYEEVRAQGIPATSAAMRARHDLPGARRALDLDGWVPDVVVSHDERSHVIARALARRQGIAHVASDHGGPGFVLRPHRELALRLLASGFAATVTITEQRVPDLLRRGFSRSRVHVIANGVDARALIPRRSRDAVRAELQIPEDAFVALMASVLRPEKRPDRFVSVIARANSLDPRIRGLLAGYGPEEARIRGLAARAGDSVRVLGDRRDIPDLINAADVVCLTSDVEGQPYAALEAMALGKPVAAMRAGALAEVVEHESTGLLVPAGDREGLAQGLLGLARARERAEALGAAGRERQRARFDAERMSDAYARVLRDACAAPC